MRIIIDSKFGSLLKFRTQMLTYIITMIMCLCVITSQLHGVACVTMIPRLLLSALHYCFLHFPLHYGKPITECNNGSAEKFYPDSKLVQKFRYVTFCFWKIWGMSIQKQIETNKFFIKILVIETRDCMMQVKHCYWGFSITFWLLALPFWFQLYLFLKWVEEM